MRCRPGSFLRIDGERKATASAIIFLDNDNALVLTAGHSCRGRVGKKVEFRLDDAWHDLGVVHDVRKRDGFDAGLIKTTTELVDPSPIDLTDPLTSFSYDDLKSLENERCESFLGYSNRWLPGTITEVELDAEGVHSIAFTPDANHATGTNGDSGSPLIVKRDGQPLLAGIFVRLPADTRVMRFLHPAPALEAMNVPIP